MGDKKVGLNPGTMVQVSPGNFVPASDIRQINVVGQRPGVFQVLVQHLSVWALPARTTSRFSTLWAPLLFLKTSLFQTYPLTR